MAERGGGGRGYHGRGHHGRGRGGGGGRGRGRGGGGPPPGLKGREIGMWYAQRSKGKKKDKEIQEVGIFSQNQIRLDSHCVAPSSY